MTAPPSSRRWAIRFTYLPDMDAVLAEFDDVELNTPADAARWAREVDVRLGSFGHKVDLLINLDGLRVKPAASAEFGRRRAEVLAKHAKSSYRFGGDRHTVTSIFTSSVLAGAATNVCASYEEALAALRSDRKETPESARTRARRS